MTVRVTIPDVAGQRVDEVVSGQDADDLLSQAKARVARALGWKGLFLHAMSSLTFAQEVVRRYNTAHQTQYSAPQSAEEFFQLSQDLGFITVLPDGEA